MDNQNNNFNNTKTYEDYYRERRLRTNEKRQIRFIGTIIGAALLSYILLENVFAFALGAFGLGGKLQTDSTFQFALDAIFAIVGLMGSFLFFGKFIKKRYPKTELVPLSAPRSADTAIAATFFALGCCSLGNYLTSFISGFFLNAGHELSMPDLSYPEGISGFILSTLRVALVAAICEEVSLRGVTLQPLRKHGNGFAIIASAIVFAIMHGNLVQAPFALVAGIGIGIASVLTGSLWVPILIHLINNFTSVSVAYIIASGGEAAEERASVLYVIISGAFLLCGIISAFILSKKIRFIFRTPRSISGLTFTQKLCAFIINPTMIIALLYLFWVTAQYIA